MANEDLKSALHQAGIQPDELADIVEVDVKTVRRWLYGSTPYPRHRVRIARALNRPEHELWPELAPVPEQPDRSPADRPEPAIPEWEVYSEVDLMAMIESARERIDVVLAWWDQLLADPEIVAALEYRHAGGCPVRLIETATTNFPADHDPRYEFAYQDYEESDQSFSLLRFDNEILVALRFIGKGPGGENLPVIRLTAEHDPMTFSGFADHIDQFWPPSHPPKEDWTQDDLAGDRPDETEPNADSDDLPSPNGVATERPRRWPGRRPGE